VKDTEINAIRNPVSIKITIKLMPLSKYTNPQVADKDMPPPTNLDAIDTRESPLLLPNNDKITPRLKDSTAKLI
jgi:hypothetical protein